MDQEYGVVIATPIASKTGSKPLGEEEDVVATGRGIPERVILHDETHGLVEMEANGGEIVWLVCNEVTGAVDGNVEEICLEWVRGAYRGVLQIGMDMVLARVEVSVAARVTDLWRAIYTAPHEIIVEARG